MKIHFCDLCNESVPQADLDEGRAVLRNGRVVCNQCEKAMSGEVHAPVSTEKASLPSAPPPPSGAVSPAPTAGAFGAAPAGVSEATTGPSPGDSPATAGPPPSTAAPATSATPATPATSAGAAVAIALAAVALLLTVGAVYFLVEEIGKADGKQSAKVDSISRDVNQRIDLVNTNTGRRFEEAWNELDQAREDLAVLQGKLETASQSFAERVDDVRSDLARFADELAGIEEVRVEVSSHGKQLNQMSGKASDLHTQILRLGDRLVEIENRPVEVAAPIAPADVEPSRPEWWAHVADLKSQNSGTRWQAVSALGDSKDPAVAEYLAPMLKDPDIFVRMATARVLGDLEAPLGIPALIDALEDPEASVREAAVVALRSVTGREHRFDPNAKESDRAKAVRRWRDWWDKSQDDFLGPNGKGPAAGGSTTGS